MANGTTLSDIRAPDGRVVVAGDWHGNTGWAKRIVASAEAANLRTILHLGDFGIWPGMSGRAYLEQLERACDKSGIQILVTGGNHEDWEQIEAQPETDRGDGWGAVKWFTDHIGVFPRPHRFNFGGRSFLSLGGAPSIDCQWRVVYRDWWMEEVITNVMVDAAIALGPAEIMLCHDAPEPAVGKIEKILSTNPQGWSEPALKYAEEGRRRLTRAFNGVRPQLLFHGHYHLRDTDTVQGGEPFREPFTCRIESLGMDGEWRGTKENAVVLDLASLAVTPLDANWYSGQDPARWVA